MYIFNIRLRICYLNHMVIVFLFHCVDGIEDLGHGVQHPTLRQGLGLLCQGLVTDRANPEADKDVSETEEAENKDQGLQEVIRVKRVDNPAKKGVKKSVIFLFRLVKGEINEGKETYNVKCLI